MRKQDVVKLRKRALRLVNQLIAPALLGLVQLLQDHPLIVGLDVLQVGLNALIDVRKRPCHDVNEEVIHHCQGVTSKAAVLQQHAVSCVDLDASYRRQLGVVDLLAISVQTLHRHVA